MQLAPSLHPDVANLGDVVKLAALGLPCEALTDGDVLQLLAELCCQLASLRRLRLAPLHIASRLGNLALAASLVNCNVEVDVQTNSIAERSTPLHIACHYGHAAIVHLLLDAGASADAASCAGMLVTPLHIACCYGHEAIVVLLLDHGASVNATAG